MVILALVVVVFFVEAVALLSFKGGTINLFALVASAVIVVGGILGFCGFLHSIVHSSMTFCGTIFVLQHCFMFCAVALCFVPLHSFLCHGAVFVPQCHALCCGNVIGAMAVCYVQWPCTMCCSTAMCCFLCCSIVLHVAALFCVLQGCLMCHGIVQCDAVLFFVPWHCALCCGTVFCAMAMCNVP